MIRKVLVIKLILLAALGWSCGHADSKTNGELTRDMDLLKVGATPEKTSNSLSAEELCANLKDLKARPLKVAEPVGDPIYDGLLEKGIDAVPCLIEKIADTTEMNDPSPHPAHPEYCAVGDTAFFVLFDITGREFIEEEIFPARYLKHWKTEGIYTYYGYVEDPANRIKIQQWWRDWAKKNGIGQHKNESGYAVPR
jgi:hypothetical protein